MIFGAIVGDMVGYPRMFDNIRTKQFELFPEGFQFYDGTFQTLMTASALLRCKNDEPVDIEKLTGAVKDEITAWGVHYANYMYKGNLEQWLPAETAKTGDSPAIRVSPCAWYFNDLESVETAACAIARATHPHFRQCSWAQAVAGSIFILRTTHSKDEVRSYITRRNGPSFMNRTFDGLKLGRDYHVKRCGYVPAAITAFLEAQDFEDALRNAVSLGSNSGVLTTITASLAEAMWGVPEELEEAARSRLDKSMTAMLERWNNVVAEDWWVKDFVRYSQEADKERVQKKTLMADSTEMVFILDRSGSMSGLEGDTIGGFNSMIEKQKNEGGEAYVSTVLFDDVQEWLHDRVKLSDVRTMTSKEYWVRGSTALLDAVGDTIRHVEIAQEEEGCPKHTVFVIITDGYENASRNYTYGQIKDMIEAKKENDGWEFLFIGANIDAEEAASDIGISANRAVNYIADAEGTEAVYEGVAEAMCCMSAAPAYEEYELDDSWRTVIDEDYRKRSPKSKKSL